MRLLIVPLSTPWKRLWTVLFLRLRGLAGPRPLEYVRFRLSGEPPWRKPSRRSWTPVR